jgi:hypothetical protein
MSQDMHAFALGARDTMAKDVWNARDKGFVTAPV